MIDFDFVNMHMFIKVLSYTSTVFAIMFVFFCVGRFFCLTICENFDEAIMDENAWGWSTMNLASIILFWLGWYMEWEILVAPVILFLLCSVVVMAIGVSFVAFIITYAYMESLHEKIHNKKHGR